MTRRKTPFLASLALVGPLLAAAVSSQAGGRTTSPTLATSQGVASVWEAIDSLERRLLSHTHDGTDGSSTLPSVAAPAATSFSVDHGTVTNHLDVGTLDVGGVAEIGGALTENGNRVFSATSMFESSTQTITADTVIEVSHGLSGQPHLVVAVLRCMTAEHGYAVNDEVYVNENGNEGGDGGQAGLYANTTKVGYMVNGALGIVSRATGANTNITMAKWKLVFRAWY